jgi:hypothetical protein
MSSGVATRWFMISSLQPSRSSGNFTGAVSFWRTQKRVTYRRSHLCSYISRGYRVDPNSILVQLRSNWRCHCPHSTFCSTICTTGLAPYGHIAGNASNHDDATLRRSIFDHQLGSELRRVEDTHDIHRNESLMILKGSLKKGYNLVYACTWDAYVQFSSKVCRKRFEALFQALYTGDINPARCQEKNLTRISKSLLI